MFCIVVNVCGQFLPAGFKIKNNNLIVPHSPAIVGGLGFAQRIARGLKIMEQLCKNGPHFDTRHKTP
jgi:hypothetical protein